VTKPDTPAVHVIDDVPVPAVMTPFAIAHAYVAPAPALGTDAVFPVEPGHTADGAVMAEGRTTTLTVAVPDELPEHTVASETEVTAYAVETAGLTVRVAGLALMPDCTTPSVQTRLHGGVPVNTAWTTDVFPGQIVPPPLTVAVG
jgi:hypothetical protein